MTLIGTPSPSSSHPLSPGRDRGYCGHHLVPVYEERAGRDTDVYTTLLSFIKMNMKPDFVFHLCFFPSDLQCNTETILIMCFKG